MDPITAITTCFRKYVTFSGRATRPEFWYWTLFVSILSGLLSVADASLLGIDMAKGGFGVASAFSLLVTLPCMAVNTRRLHDVGRSGWWQLIALTGVGVFVLLWWWASASKDNNNSY